MSAETLTCPYCNAGQPPLPGLSVGQRVTCVRCGEAFKVTTVPAAPAEAPPADITEAPSAPPAKPSRPIRANRLVAGLVLGVMLVMAGTGLTYALLTVQQRRAHDRALPRKSRRPWLTEQETPPDVVASTDLAGLGYLPPSTGVVAALQVEELQASPAGKALRSRPLKIGNGDFTLDHIRDWTGVEVENLAHVILGVVVRDGDEADLTPAVHLVVRTRKPYSPERVRVALKASRSREERTPEGGKRTLYAASVGKLPVQLWLADERTLVVGLFSKMEQVPGKPHDGLSQLPAELRQAIEKRVVAGAPAWAAGHSVDWKKTWLPTVVGAVKDVPLLGRLEDVRTFALWLVATEPAKVGGAFRCANETAAAKIAREDLVPRQKDSPEAFKFSREGEWLDVQVTLPQK
jgi:hypothetical protein